MSKWLWPRPWMRNTVLGIASVVADVVFEYAEYPAAFCARTRNVYVVFGWRFAREADVGVAAAPTSEKLEEPVGWDSTLIAVASGALFVQVRFTCLEIGRAHV